ncbi:hypothetical protein F3Y22_tig00005459pilonHSYRG00365 [Hibiscus syriacus]|uniref:CCHC-type domain-containing protein n=1 Tax=Hibiscus syriacus TaxID=106335 RepID=A0A6A3CGA3_HIBSY|nr:hypothetical protein F3Y22_tig00005459pilonHSYRG00365 [Hibiscus syriacus]
MRCRLEIIGDDLRTSRPVVVLRRLCLEDFRRSVKNEAKEVFETEHDTLQEERGNLGQSIFGSKVNDMDTVMTDGRESNVRKGDAREKDINSVTLHSDNFMANPYVGCGKLSFRDMVKGSSMRGQLNVSTHDMDVDVLPKDIKNQFRWVFPEIKFSGRVHDAKLANSIVVWLLDKSIGYRALLNRIKMIWNPQGEINLIDLDNEYYMVRYANEEDYNHVLSRGPWIIYRCYLTVQPWSRSFSTKAGYPKKIMAWCRLSGLPYHYYIRSLFRYIAKVIGTVVRVDYNTEDGSRGYFVRLIVVVDLEKPLMSRVIIDGHKQPVKYEGLPSICYTCGKYGHVQENCGEQFIGHGDEW